MPPELGIPRARNLGNRLGDPPAGEHFIRCPACGGLIDCRDLGQVFEHQGSGTPAWDQPYGINRNEQGRMNELPWSDPSLGSGCTLAAAGSGPAQSFTRATAKARLTA